MVPELRERIRRRAHELWEQEGRADAHWLQAELELRAPGSQN